MRAQAHTLRAEHAGASRAPFWRRQGFWRIALPVGAALSVIVAILVILQVSVGSNGTPNAATGWGVTYPAVTKPKTVKFDPAAQLVATRFVKTAVARKNLDQAYAIAGPGVRQGMTLKQFMSGNIPVVPYPVTSKTSANMKIDESYAKSATVELYLVTPGSAGRDFYVNLVKKHGQWFVDAWVPRGTPPIPTNPGG